MESERCGTQEYYGFHLVLNLANFCVDFCVDFALILQICADFAPIFEPKSWSQTNKLDLVFLKLKNRKPLYLLGISDFSTLGARWDSNL